MSRLICLSLVVIILMTAIMVVFASAMPKGPSGQQGVGPPDRVDGQPACNSEERSDEESPFSCAIPVAHEILRTLRSLRMTHHSISGIGS